MGPLLGRWIILFLFFFSSFSLKKLQKYEYRFMFICCFFILYLFFFFACTKSLIKIIFTQKNNYVELYPDNVACRNGYWAAHSKTYGYLDVSSCNKNICCWQVFKIRARLHLTLNLNPRPYCNSNVKLAGWKGYFSRKFYFKITQKAPIKIGNQEHFLYN